MSTTTLASNTMWSLFDVTGNPHGRAPGPGEMEHIGGLGIVDVKETKSSLIGDPVTQAWTTMILSVQQSLANWFLWSSNKCPHTISFLDLTPHSPLHTFLSGCVLSRLTRVAKLVGKGILPNKLLIESSECGADVGVE